MNQTITRSFIMAFVTIVFLQSNVYAAPNIGDKFGGWVYECQAVAANKTVCSITQTLISKRSKKRLLSVILSRRGEKKELRLIVITPLGIYIPSGVTAAIDEDSKMALRLRTCNQQGCITNTKVDNKLKSKLSEGKELVVGFDMGGGKNPLFIKVSLKGVTKGLKALGE